jgi:hypothetical protein
MATFKYTLRNLDNQIEFDTSLVKNWEDTMPEAVLSDTYKSVMRDFSNTYEFTGFAKQFIIKSIEKYGYDCPLFLTVEVGNDNAEMHSFEVLANNMIAEISKMDETEISVNLNFIDSEFKSKLFDRDGIKTNLNVLKSIDGRVLQKRDLLNDLFMHDRGLLLKTEYETKTLKTEQIPLSITGLFKRLSLPFKLKYKSDSDWKETVNIITDVSEIGAHTLFLNASKKRENYVINIDVSGIFKITDSQSSSSYSVQISKIDKENNEVIIKQYNQGIIFGGNISQISCAIKQNLIVDINEGDSLFIGIAFGGGLQGKVAGFYDLDKANLTAEVLDRAPSSFTKIMFPHEIFERLAEILTGESFAFYSEYFGRPELGYKEYGAGSLFGIANGAMIRQFPYKDKPLNISLEDAFKTYNCMFNLDAWIEERNGKSVFRIEPAEKKPDLKDKIVINIYEEVTRKIDSKKLYTEIKVGYKDQEYEEINGLQAFNGESVFATPLNVAENVLDLINPSRADDIGAEITRRQQYIDNPTKDYRADSHNFVFDCIPNQIAADGRVLNYSLRLPDSKAKITGVFEPELGYNYSISPRRCLQNHSANIRACLVQKDTNSLKFVKSAKNANLSSDFPNGIKYVESDDIIISDLNRAFELPEIYMVTGAKISLSDWQKIKDKPRVKISLMINENEYICSIKAFAYNVAKNTADCELIRLNF